MKRVLSIIAISSLPLISQADTYNVSDKFYVGFGAGMISLVELFLLTQQLMDLLFQQLLQVNLHLTTVTR